MNMRIRGAVNRLMESPEPTPEMLNLRSVALYYLFWFWCGAGEFVVVTRGLLSFPIFAFTFIKFFRNRMILKETVAV